MSNIYTYSEARQNLASLLDKAAQEGEIKIRRKDGQVFVVKPEAKTGSPLDVEGIDLGLTVAEIVAFVQESRSLKS
jgi:antitoxin Phd